MSKPPKYLNNLWGWEDYNTKIPVSHSTVTEVQEVALKFHNNPKNHIHKEDPQEEVLAVSDSWKAEL